jgi:hypothetical protein
MRRFKRIKQHKDKRSKHNIISALRILCYEITYHIFRTFKVMVTSKLVV